jgi:monovalent cation/proton antiporter MnhG/PhaG subunit
LSLRELAVAALLVVGVAAALLSCLGVLVMGNAYDRLHYTAPAATLAPALLAAAIVLEEGLSAVAVKALLVALVLVATNPVLSHATARAARIRQFGHWSVQEHEQGERPP